ncbi:polysaccharide biosynthesis tyrosine autokinase [Acaryochloris sp. CCMEE 5410]|uniref:GumC family protein n=1 Tax=Acaryochloris sp. CCMEE 5410 TaxID=310037 RepID=UPI0002484E59|nr:polysaccharide biosynthesis tyrosine autokinase [Acaryochloris sp. CCMEE 5410]
MTHTPVVMESSQQSDFIKYWLMVRRRWLPASLTFLVVLVISLFRVYQEEPKYIASGQLKFEEGQRSSELIGLDSAINENERGQSSMQWQRSLDTEVLSMSSPEQLIKVLEKIGDPRIQPSLGEMQENLRIVQLDETNVVAIRYSANKPELSAAVVNQIMQQYVDENLEKNRASTLAAIDFINRQLPEVKQRVFRSDSALRRFKETYQINDLDSAKEANAKAQNDLQVTLDQTHRQLSETQAQQQKLQSLLGLDPQQALLTITTSHASITKSHEEVEKQIAEARSNFHPDHPVIQELVERQVQLQALLKQKAEESTQSTSQLSLVGNQQHDLRAQLIQLEIKRRGLEQQLATFRNQLSRYNLQAKTLPQLEQQQNDLERNAKAAASTYQNLLEQIQELKVTANQATPTVKILQNATRPEPTRTTYMSAGMRGGMAGLLLAASIVYLLERVDRKLKSKEDIRQIYPYRILGEIPTFAEAEGEYSKLPTLANPASHVSEAYRMLQASLKFLSLELSPRIIMVTSAITQEGKSTTCANLAASLSQMNHRVLLIDADVRLASQHHIWELKNQEGLTHILLRNNVVEQHSLPTHRVSKGLDVITAGRISSNPLPMLESEEFSAFVQGQLDTYDYVLIDSPPLVSVADPLVIGKIADGIVLVARPEHLERELAQKANELLTQSNLIVLGTVINGVIDSNEPHSYYSYYGRYTDQVHSSSNGLVKQLTELHH